MASLDNLQGLVGPKGYDAVVRIDRFQHVFDANLGWKLATAEGAIERLDGFSGVRVVPIGHFGAGKTWLIGKLCEGGDTELASGTDVHTEGLSLKVAALKGQTKLKCAFLDTAGLNSPVTSIKALGSLLKGEDGRAVQMTAAAKMRAMERMLEELKRQETFVRQVGFEFAQAFLMVVGQISHREQQDLLALIEEAGRSESAKQVIVVHNLKTMTYDSFKNDRDAETGLTYLESMTKVFRMAARVTRPTSGGGAEVDELFGAFGTTEAMEGEGKQTKAKVAIRHVFVTNDKDKASAAQNEAVFAYVRETIGTLQPTAGSVLTALGKLMTRHAAAAVRLPAGRKIEIRAHRARGRMLAGEVDADEAAELATAKTTVDDAPRVVATRVVWRVAEAAVKVLRAAGAEGPSVSQRVVAAAGEAAVGEAGLEQPQQQHQAGGADDDDGSDDGRAEAAAAAERVLAAVADAGGEARGWALACKAVGLAAEPAVAAAGGAGAGMACVARAVAAAAEALASGAPVATAAEAVLKMLTGAGAGATAPAASAVPAADAAAASADGRDDEEDDAAAGRRGADAQKSAAVLERLADETGAADGLAVLDAADEAHSEAVVVAASLQREPVLDASRLTLLDVKAKDTKVTCKDVPLGAVLGRKRGSGAQVGHTVTRVRGWVEGIPHWVTSVHVVLPGLAAGEVDRIRAQLDWEAGGARMVARTDGSLEDALELEFEAAVRALPAKQAAGLRKAGAAGAGGQAMKFYEEAAETYAEVEDAGTRPFVDAAAGGGQSAVKLTVGTDVTGCIGEVAPVVVYSRGVLTVTVCCMLSEADEHEQPVEWTKADEAKACAITPWVASSNGTDDDTTA